VLCTKSEVKFNKEGEIIMKKLFLVIGLVALLGVVPAFAGDNHDEAALTFGAYDIEARTYDGAIDYDHQHIPNGFAGGISAAGGFGQATSEGFIFNGMVEGEVNTFNGGVTRTNSYRFNPGIGDKSIGVGSSSDGSAITSADAKIKVDPDGKLIFGFIPTAGGAADARIKGIAGQGTANVSGLTGSPKFGWESDGHTGGIAVQGSVGGFEGEAYALSGPDYTKKWYHKTGKCRGHWHRDDIDSKAGAGMGAEVAMQGGSTSESYRYIDWFDGGKTEGMGTNVESWTNVQSSGYAYDWDKGLSTSNANLNGGWVAGGFAASKTHQENASASAKGYYFGAGQLGTNYQGSAIGGTYTNVTTFEGYKGSFQGAGANMSVTSRQGSGNNQDPQ